MTMVQIGRVTTEGREEFSTLIRKNKRGSTLLQEGADPNAIFRNEKFYQPIPGAPYIDISRKFKTNLEFMEYVSPLVQAAVKGNPAALAEDLGLNGFINVAFVMQLTERHRGRGRGLRTPDAYLLGISEVADVRTRNYRSTVFVLMLFYALYGDDEDLCQSFLATRFGDLNNPLERMCQRVDLMCSRGAWKMVQAMFSGTKPGKYHNPKKGEAPMGTLSASNAVQRTVAILFDQCSRNMDVERMSAEELLALVPRSAALEFWCRRGTDRLQADKAQKKADRKSRSA